MTRLQKKCFVAAAGTHVLLLVVVLASAAIRPEPELTTDQVLEMLPTTVLDRNGVGGAAPAPVSPVSPVESPPARTTNPSPPKENPAPVREPRRQPPAHEATTHESQSKVTETPAKPPKSVPADKPSLEHKSAKPGIVPDFGRPVKLGSKKTTKESDSANSTSSSASNSSNSSRSDARTKLEAEFARETAALEKLARSIGSPPTVVVLPGSGGGESFIGYRNLVSQYFYRAWKTPDESSDKIVTVDVLIVVARDGRVNSAEILRASGNPAMDHSVQRALDEVRANGLPPFPAGATEDQRNFKLRFNLEQKQSSG
jgi:TonB family protein